MSRALGRDHDHIHIAGGDDGLEMNAESVREPQNLTLGEAALDGLIKNRVGLIGSENVDPIPAFRRLGRREHGKAVVPRLFRATPGRIEAYNHLVTGVAQVLRLRVSLTSVSQDRDGLAL